MKNIFPSIPKTPFLAETFGAHKWYYPKDRIGETLMVNGKSVKKMLTLDLNIPDEAFALEVNNTNGDKNRVFAKNYPCVHSCPGCFNNAQVKNDIMTWEEVKAIVDQALVLGLESVKFLGPGELTMNPRLFEILDYFQKNNIVVGLFTKAALLGSDILAMKYHGISSQELVDRLTAYNNITFLIGGRSFDPEVENKYIPTKDPDLRSQFDYHAARNLAIERLAKAGMNTDPDKQRLAIIASPVTAETVDGVFEIFQWATERNIPLYVTTSMVSGKGHSLVRKQQVANFETDLINLSVCIYRYMIQKGLTTKERLRSEGVSAYIGIVPCNQLTHGLYIHYDGEVLRCPGNDNPEFIVHDDVRNKPLVDIWVGSKNYRSNRFNNQCVKDGITIPSGFYKNVLAGVLGE